MGRDGSVKFLVGHEAWLTIEPNGAVTSHDGGGTNPAHAAAAFMAWLERATTPRSDDTPPHGQIMAMRGLPAGAIVFGVPEYPDALRIESNDDVVIKGRAQERYPEVYKRLVTWLEGRSIVMPDGSRGRLTLSAPESQVQKEAAPGDRSAGQVHGRPYGSPVLFRVSSGIGGDGCGGDVLLHA